jgi:histidinol-phosphate aminotransferase
VVVLKPSYAMYRFYSEVAGAKVVEVEYPQPGWSSAAGMLDAITPETRAVMFANPNNPTGTGVSLLGIERILKRARKAV